MRRTGSERALELLQQVKDTDNHFVPAYAATAEIYVHLQGRGRDRESSRHLREAAQQAIDLDPLLPLAQATVAVVRAREQRWQDAESAFRRALALDRADAQRAGRR